MAKQRTETRALAADPPAWHWCGATSTLVRTWQLCVPAGLWRTVRPSCLEKFPHSSLQKNATCTHAHMHRRTLTHAHASTRIHTHTHVHASTCSHTHTRQPSTSFLLATRQSKGGWGGGFFTRRSRRKRAVPAGAACVQQCVRLTYVVCLVVRMELA